MFEALSENLNGLMASRGISALRLARESGVPLSTIKKLRNQDINNPTFATVFPLAQYFSVSLDYLLTKKPLSPEEKHGGYPVLNWEEVIHWPKLDRPFPIIPSTTSYRRSTFALKIQDQAKSVFPQEAILLIDSEMKPQHKDYVLVSVASSKEVYLKQFLKEENQAYLKSTEVASHITPLTSRYRILGVVMEYRKSLRSKKEAKEQPKRVLKPAAVSLKQGGY